MNENEFRQLVERYITGEISGADQQQFFDLLEQESYRRLLEEILHEEWKGGNHEEELYPQIEGLIEQYVLRKIQGRKPALVRSITFFQKYRLAAAAVLIFVVAATLLIVYATKTRNESKLAVSKEQVKKTDIGPATNGAILTLDNGAQITLDSTRSGLIAQQGGSQIVKQGGELKYQSEGKSTQVVYNTISTPKGKQYPNLVLADGSKVWLDAGSSIRFPVAFTGEERKVEVTGQVWLEVVHNSRMPFKVIARGVEVNDLGTEFNVNAYGDEENLKVTLLKGAISVQSRVLKPGQQAQIGESGKMRIVDNVNTEEVMAWKNGLFQFTSANIQTVMRELSRWYDVDIVFADNLQVRISGEMRRNTNLSEMLRAIELTASVKFKMEGKSVIVMKK